MARATPVGPETVRAADQPVDARVAARRAREQAKALERGRRDEARRAALRERVDRREAARLAPEQSVAGRSGSRVPVAAAAAADTAATPVATDRDSARPDQRPAEQAQQAQKAKQAKQARKAKQAEQARQARRLEQAKKAKQSEQAKLAKQAERERARSAKQAELEQVKQAEQAERKRSSVARGPADDHIVEPPREPKVSFAERRRRAAAARRESSGDGTRGGGRRAASLAAAALGAIGLICSVVLAIGALLVAMGSAEGDQAYDTVSAVCDVLVGPLRDMVSFSGADADMKESLVAWGIGSMGYLFVGLVAQSFLRSRIDDD